MIGWHLSGKDNQGRNFVAGVYPLLQDDTCFFLAIDLDDEGWREDALACMETCRQLGLPVAVEKSRSGNGAHLWFFFEEAIPAYLARNLGSYCLTETMERRPELGLKSYDRLFPSQNTVPKGGFGNLIALPLQKVARAKGNSLFLDEELNPHPDQWKFLGSIRKLSRSEVEALVRKAESRGRILGIRLVPDTEESQTPWVSRISQCRPDPKPAGPLPSSLTLILADQIYILKEPLSPPLRNRLIRMAAFQNPQFYKAQAMRLPTHLIPRIIGCAEEHLAHIGLPRGCLEEVLALMKSLQVPVTVQDERCHGVPLDVDFQGVLRLEQEQAGLALLSHDTGTLSATTAFGKTVIAAWLIAKRRVNTLVLVHRQQLMDQWVERLATFLNVPIKDIGRLGGGRRRLNGRLDVALIQSLIRKTAEEDPIAGYGQIIVDECHHIPAVQFELIAKRGRARFVTGLSATLARKDGHHPIVFMQCGPVRHRVDARSQAAKRPFTHHVYVRPTPFITPSTPTDSNLSSEHDARVEFRRIYEALIDTTSRNELICSDVLAALQAGRVPLVLTERTRHLELLAEQLGPHVPNLILLRGGMGRRQAAVALSKLGEMSSTSTYAVLATGHYVGEGFDHPRLDTLFIAMPVSWRGTIAQYVGRLHRLHTDKREVRVYDYADLNVPMLARMFDRRCRGYEALGYTLLLPGSALPGWPTEVPLPVDPQWKRDYAASVQRLIRDGIDVPLATLFARASGTISDEAVGQERARSASEAFFYKRLQTLPTVKNRFQLNAQLPIPFDGSGTMEVDFLCADARLVIELDGMQHLSDVEAWRRDRRKDLLLQHHGYLVLRFLTTDLTRHLDTILDTLQASLVHQANHLSRQPASE
jgi:superfamily II DNA or RNA helicase/very-short-patch-repair endonuclease